MTSSGEVRAVVLRRRRGRAGRRHETTCRRCPTTPGSPDDEEDTDNMHCGTTLYIVSLYYDYIDKQGNSFAADVQRHFALQQDTENQFCTSSEEIDTP